MEYIDVVGRIIDAEQRAKALAEAGAREREQLRSGLEEIAAQVPGADYRGRGLLAGIRFEDPDLAEKVAAEAFRRHLLVETSGADSEVVKVMPPLTISAADLAHGLDILRDATVTTAAAAA